MGVVLLGDADASAELTTEAAVSSPRRRPEIVGIRDHPSLRRVCRSLQQQVQFTLLDITVYPQIRSRTYRATSRDVVQHPVVQMTLSRT